MARSAAVPLGPGPPGGPCRLRLATGGTGVAPGGSGSRGQEADGTIPGGKCMDAGEDGSSLQCVRSLGMPPECSSGTEWCREGGAGAEADLTRAVPVGSGPPTGADVEEKRVDEGRLRACMTGTGPPLTIGGPGTTPAGLSTCGGSGIVACFPCSTQDVDGVAVPVAGKLLAKAKAWESIAWTVSSLAGLGVPVSSDCEMESSAAEPVAPISPALSSMPGVLSCMPLSPVASSSRTVAVTWSTVEPVVELVPSNGRGRTMAEEKPATSHEASPAGVCEPIILYTALPLGPAPRPANAAAAAAASGGGWPSETCSGSSSGAWGRCALSAVASSDLRMLPSSSCREPSLLFASASACRTSSAKPSMADARACVS